MFLLVPPTALVYIEDTYNFQDFLSLLKLIYTAFKRVSKVKLDGVGPVDNRPSTDKLHQFVQKKKEKILVIYDIWHVTRDTWHVTRDIWNMKRTWHVTCDILWEVNILSKFQLPSSYCLWFMILWRSGGKGWRTDLIIEWMNESMTRLFIEQPRLQRVC